MVFILEIFLIYGILYMYMYVGSAQISSVHDNISSWVNDNSEATCTCTYMINHYD